MGAHAVTPTLGKLKQENDHNLTQWVTDQTSLDYNVTLHTSNKPIHTHKDKTQILINNLINSNKQIKMQSASFQYCSIASPVWQSIPHLSVSLPVLLSQRTAADSPANRSNPVSLLPFTLSPGSSSSGCVGKPIFLQRLHRAPSGPLGSVAPFSTCRFSMFSRLGCF